MKQKLLLGFQQRGKNSTIFSNWMWFLERWIYERVGADGRKQEGFSERFSSLLDKSHGAIDAGDLIQTKWIEDEKIYFTFLSKIFQRKSSLEKTLEASSDFLTHLTSKCQADCTKWSSQERENEFAFLFKRNWFNSRVGSKKNGILHWIISMAISQVLPLDLPNVIT